MAKRTKKVILSGVTSERMESAFSEYAAVDAKLAKINATMDEQITRIREKYSDEITKLSEVRDKSFEVVQTYAQENRDVIFSKKKSLEAAHGTFGFRTGTPKLKTLRGFTWASAEKLIQAFLPEYIRTKSEPAKDKLLADRDKKEVASKLEECGLQIVQDETFYIELKKEEQETA